jgi:hypothetical protein
VASSSERCTKVAPRKGVSYKIVTHSQKANGQKKQKKNKKSLSGGWVSQSSSVAH